MYSARDTLAGGFPHSDIFGSMLVCELPEAFRTLQRPSSPVIAKASTTCTYSLDPITLMPLSRQPLTTAVTGIEFRVCAAFQASSFQRTLKTWLIQSHPMFDITPRQYRAQRSIEAHYFASSRLLKIEQPIDQTTKGKHITMRLALFS